MRPTPIVNEDNLITLLQFLKQVRSIDLAGYKHGTLIRRVTRRLQIIGISTIDEYLDYLEVHPDEYAQLLNTIFINVTSFFRDESAWEVLAKEIIPQIINSQQDKMIRIWSAGCATGEEPYSLAMLLAESMDVEEFRRRVKIYATDVDEDELTRARHATYTTKDLAPLPEDLRKRYFDKNGSLYTLRLDLRRAVIFGRHDLTQDAPISNLDLMVCRNTLMYFNTEVQRKILARLHFALNPKGYLFLGKAEMLLTQAYLFTPVSLKYRIFQKVPSVNVRDNHPMMLSEAEAMALPYTL